jgi:hypothetical protein
VVLGRFQFGLFHNFASNIWFNLKPFLPSMGYLGGILHPICEFRDTDHLCFTANPPQLQVDLNLSFFPILLQVFGSICNCFWSQFRCMLHPKCEFKGADHLCFTANPPRSQADLNLAFFTISLQFEAAFAPHGQLGGPLHPKCESRGTDHLCFTSNCRGPRWVWIRAFSQFFFKYLVQFEAVFALHKAIQRYAASKIRIQRH